ncbi:MalY/PatB family protein [Enterocloster citroniae]|uniref:MalY/PatB family protein n=1 Tax=Enterocloster citroniae TaxID=358743 RepID=UPI001D062C04|nr:pyridoxal phosphate-dependent aminotransferase [Enterocloster citroniae]MCD8279524.1 pyridoxal phosphate-dependent aminotransferase [Enterocloster citroniae]
MPYDFERIVNRRGTASLKWDVEEQELPMWVADMDFQTAPEIMAAIRERADHGIFGYTVVPDAWYKAIQDWWKKRHGFLIEKEWLLFSTGVVPAISSIVRKMTTAGENIVIQTPVYNVFFNSIRNNGRNVLESRLRWDNGQYRIDFEDLEEKFKNPQTTMMILCNPHNPIGKIWDRETLERVGELAYKHHVLVLSDEIHCDLTDPGHEYIPFASVSEMCRNNSITCIAPTKTFNLAGLQTAAVAVPDENLRHKVNRGLNTDEVAEPNVFAITAAVAAFTKGEAWLEELRSYLKANKDYVREYLALEIPEITAVPSDATYLLWLDCRKLIGDSTMLCRFIRSDSGLYLSDGKDYGNGQSHLRMNVACPREQLREGLARLKKSVAAYGAWASGQC